MPFPAGVPAVTRVIKNGKGGPNKDSLPVYEDLGGERTAYLKNDTVIKIVDPTYPGIAKYAKLWNGTMYVSFTLFNGSDLVPGKESWCESTGHVYAVASDPQDLVQLVEYEVIEERVTAGRKFIKLQKT
jgi:hypothetical protein